MFFFPLLFYCRYLAVQKWKRQGPGAVSLHTDKRANSAEVGYSHPLKSHLPSLAKRFHCGLFSLDRVDIVPLPLVSASKRLTLKMPGILWALTKQNSFLLSFVKETCVSILWLFLVLFLASGCQFSRTPCDKWHSYSKPMLGFPDGASDKESTCQCRRGKRHEVSLWVRKIPGVGNVNPLSILAWKIPWTEEPGRPHTVHGAAKSQIWLSAHTHPNNLPICSSGGISEFY